MSFDLSKIEWDSASTNLASSAEEFLERLNRLCQGFVGLPTTDETVAQVKNAIKEFLDAHYYANLIQCSPDVFVTLDSDKDLCLRLVPQNIKWLDRRLLN